MLKGKTVLIGVTGSIAAYKAAALCSALVKQHCDVHVLMSENATYFVNPITFETLTSNKCLVDTFDRNFQYSVEHVALAKKADLVMIAPATANVMAKLACGLADDMLTTTVLACRCKKIIAPAMNTAMYENPVTQRNLSTLKELGFLIAEPSNGYLACGDTGVGKMMEPEDLLEWIFQEIACAKDLLGYRILVTAGATQEAIDPVRYISNHSSGKMGYAIARAASRRGADVTLVSGKTNLKPVPFVRTIPVVSAQDMFEAVVGHAENADIVIKAAAVADYTPQQVADQKIKKSDDDMAIPLTRTKDIIGYLGAHKREGQFLCGFSMETENLIENSKKKLIKKNLDLIAANSVSDPGAGFAVDTNIITLISQDQCERLELMSKDKAAHKLLDRILLEIGQKAN